MPRLVGARPRQVRSVSPNSQWLASAFPLWPNIEAILTWTHGRFGEQVRLRYEELLVQAILDLADYPRRPGSVERPELASGAYTYRLRYRRNYVARPIGRIRKPRHFLLFRIAADGGLEIGRVLHDSMDVACHLPPEY